MLLPIQTLKVEISGNFCVLFQWSPNCNFFSNVSGITHFSPVRFLVLPNTRQATD